MESGPACVHADYQGMFDSLGIAPDVWLVSESYSHVNKTVKRRAMELEIDVEDLEWPDDDCVDLHPLCVLEQVLRGDDLEPVYHSRSCRDRALGVGDYMLDCSSGGCYCMADPAMRPQELYTTLALGELHRDAPFVEREEERKLVGLYLKLGKECRGYRGRGGRSAQRHHNAS